MSLCSYRNSFSYFFWIEAAVVELGRVFFSWECCVQTICFAREDLCMIGIGQFRCMCCLVCVASISIQKPRCRWVRWPNKLAHCICVVYFVAPGLWGVEINMVSLTGCNSATTKSSEQKSRLVKHIKSYSGVARVKIKANYRPPWTRICLLPYWRKLC